MEIHNITVSEKTPDHPFFGKGSKYGFNIDGKSGAILYLKAGQVYQLNINTPGHPFYFTSSPIGGDGMPSSLMGDINPVEYGSLKFIASPNGPRNFYYQCALHPQMGSYVSLI